MKCSRCGEEMSLIERNRVNDEIICNMCHEEAKESGEVSEKEDISYPSIDILRVLDIIFLFAALVSVISGAAPGSGTLLSIIYIILIFFTIWVITVIAKLAVKIYKA